MSEEQIDKTKTRGYVILRGVIYVFLAIVPVWTAYFSKVGDELLANKTPLFHWAILAGVTMNSLYQAGLALRAYLDGSAERARVPNKETKPT